MKDELFKVLIADDEFWIRESLRMLLDWEACGMSLLGLACDGEEAFEITKNERVDILITDVNMPYMSGIELIRKMKQASPDTVVLALSGYGDYEYVREALVEGAADYLLKPVTKTGLLDALNRAMDKSLLARREKRDMESVRESLAVAQSALLDRDLSTLLHEARQGLTGNAQARLFEYEQRFSGFRLTLLRLGTRVGNSEEVYSLKRHIRKCVPLDPMLIIHDLYHATHFLMITEPNDDSLRKRLPDTLAALEKLTGAPVQAVVSAAYLTFGELRKACDEARTTLMTMPLKPGNLVVFASEMENTPMTRRLDGALERRLNEAARTQDREAFDRLIKQTGLSRCEEENWTRLETLHFLNTVAWILRRSVEETSDPARQLVMDTLIETLPGAMSDARERDGVLMQLEDEAFSAPSPDKPQAAHDVAYRVKEYVDLHYMEELSLGALARRFNLDDSYLSKRFKQTAGCNLTLYIAGLRIEHAKRVLKSKELSITDVAQLVGYDDYAYFSRVFKKLAGVSPRAYREGDVE